MECLKWVRNWVSFGSQGRATGGFAANILVRVSVFRRMMLGSIREHQAWVLGGGGCSHSGDRGQKFDPGQWEHEVSYQRLF